MIPIKNGKLIKHVITAVQGTLGPGRGTLVVLRAPEQNSSRMWDGISWPYSHHPARMAGMDKSRKSKSSTMI